jgi:hypothetical protein
MKYTAEMSSGAICIPSFINMCSGTERLMGGGYRDTKTRIYPYFFFQNKESRLNWDGSVTVLPEVFELYLSMYTAYS